MRVNDYTVTHYLTWARNYGEIESFERIAASGRKWLIRLPRGVTFTADGADVGWLTGREGVVPDEMVLTSREALVFGYGLAIAGARERRADIAAREWGWDEPSDDADDELPDVPALGEPEGPSA